MAEYRDSLVSKDTVALSVGEWKKLGVIKEVDKGWITTVEDLEGGCFER